MRCRLFLRSMRASTWTHFWAMFLIVQFVTTPFVIADHVSNHAIGEQQNTYGCPWGHARLHLYAFITLLVRLARLIYNIYGVPTLCLAGKFPSLRSYTVCMTGSGQPQLSVHTWYHACMRACLCVSSRLHACVHVLCNVWLTTNLNHVCYDVLLRIYKNILSRRTRMKGEMKALSISDITMRDTHTLTPTPIIMRDTHTLSHPHP